MKEYEIRSLIPPDRLESILETLESIYEEHDSEQRFTVVHVGRADFFPDPERKLDTKIRSNGKTARLTVKLGSWHSSTGREELEIDISPKDFQTALVMLNCLGLNYFVAMATHRRKFLSLDVEITVDVIMPAGIIVLEAEYKGNIGNISEIENALQNVLKKIGLSPIGSEETRQYVERINREVRGQIDFENTTLPEWIDKNREWIGVDV